MLTATTPPQSSSTTRPQPTAPSTFQSSSIFLPARASIASTHRQRISTGCSTKPIRSSKTASFPRPSGRFARPFERNPDDSLAHYVLATALSANDQEREALAEYQKASELTPTNPTFLDHLAVSLALNGDP